VTEARLREASSLAAQPSVMKRGQRSIEGSAALAGHVLLHFNAGATRLVLLEGTQHRLKDYIKRGYEEEIEHRREQHASDYGGADG
jgi:hypothetical protein